MSDAGKYFLVTSLKVDNFELFSQLLTTILKNELMLDGFFQCDVNGRLWCRSFGK